MPKVKFYTHRTPHITLYNQAYNSWSARGKIEIEGENYFVIQTAFGTKRIWVISNETDLDLIRRIKQEFI